MFQLRTASFSRLLPALALASLAGLALQFSAGQAAAQEGDGEHAEHHDDEHGELHESMERMQASMKALRRVFSKPEEKAKALELCRTIEAGALEGFQLAPDAPEGLDEAQAFAFQLDFRRRMLEVASTTLDLEVAIQNEDAEEGKALYRKLGESKKDGHDTYIK